MGHFIFHQGRDVKFHSMGITNFFNALKLEIAFLLVLTRSYKSECTTHLQHVIEHDSGLFWLCK